MNAMSDMDERDLELERLRGELTQTRLDLMQSDAIRSAFVEQTCGLAKDMSRAFEMVEAAFHAGHKAAHENPDKTADEAYNNWTKDLKK